MLLNCVSMWRSYGGPLRMFIGKLKAYDQHNYICMRVIIRALDY
jgi:hypothetical protein